jgi:pyruvate/2-oxoglutarate dehydrogenase complex dihydrolipoamide dehydrogenase (E3) component
VPRSNEETDWQPVIGRSLAFLCLHYAEMRSKTLLEQANFLENLGLPRAEAAAVLGTTKDSLDALGRQQRKRASKKTAPRKKSTSRRKVTRARRS